MNGIISVNRMKELEENSDRMGISYLRLMENAGCAAAAAIARKVDVRGRCCAVVAGKGNNGGDAFVAARKLYENEALVTVILADGFPATEQAREMLDRLLRLGVEVIPFDRENPSVFRKIEGADIIVDGIFGTGFHGQLTEDLLALFSLINRSVAAVFSLDIPSGVNGYNGHAASGAIKADFTIAFHRAKAGMYYYPAKEFIGEVEEVQIGIPDQAGDDDGYLIEEEDIFEAIKKRPADSHKGFFGHLLQVCGSIGFTGAAILCATGSARVGTGLITCAAPASVLASLNVRLPEAMTLPLALDQNGNLHEGNTARLLHALEGKSALLLGCGIGKGRAQEIFVREMLLNAECPVIVDADGINTLLADIDILKQVKVPVILTPHMGEMARLLGISVKELKENRIDKVKAFAEEFGVMVVLKDSVTTVFAPRGSWFVNQTGNAGLAKGGSGDLLAGMIAGFCAQGLSPLKSAVCGVFLHGMAADRCAVRRGQYSMLASDVAEDIAGIFAERGL